MVRIYDNNNETLDRYTIIDLSEVKKPPQLTDCVSASTTGNSVYLHSTCMVGNHLGSIVPFSRLHPLLRARLVEEFGAEKCLPKHKQHGSKV